MSTSTLRSGTSKAPSKNSTTATAKSLPKPPLNHASPNTGTTEPAMPSSNGWQQTSPNSALKRERFLVQHTVSGEYLAGANKGKLLWTDNPLQAFRYSLMETVQEQLRATREFYQVPDVQVASVVFTVDANQPDRLDAWTVSSDAQ
jgi:hypothetical protein